MEDCEIVEMYWQRNQYALNETDKKYGTVLRHTSFSILGNYADAEECKNDTYLKAWNTMPTERPIYLCSYLMKIIRNLSISRYRSEHREKRGGNNAALVIDELEDCIPSGENTEKESESGMLREALSAFLLSLSEEKRTMFILRYFNSASVSDISKKMNISESKIKTTLFRIREMLKGYLERGGLM